MDPEPRPRRRPPSSTSGSARGLQQPLGGDGAPGSARPGERNHSPARCGCVRRRGRRCGRSGQRPGRGSRPSAPRAPSSEDRVAPAPRSVNSAVAFGQKQENRDLEKVLRRLNSLCGSREQNEDQLAEPSRRQVAWRPPEHWKRENGLKGAESLEDPPVSWGSINVTMMTGSSRPTSSHLGLLQAQLLHPRDA
ncbi:uncharacterized protein LOC132362587 isoform X5 [Balaenoptera ricei]|uniref:uncharacterized protein LOC132362587 isoform X5 n=1 Tax=Balaenoptera ricei TaxID=2746895 RepID=UPI0028BEB25C|nr:uncharacterized protein LOC132362587 isoform X5 [Balaenoptera ricei]